MPDKFLKVVVLAAVADGEIQDAELAVVNNLKAAHPLLKDISDVAAQSSVADVYNKLSAGMEAKHILEQIGAAFSEKEKHQAYALAREVCAADHKILPAEDDFITTLEQVWSIPKEVMDAVSKSLGLRYSI
jgi:uncharacterized membrane protein YebE (DUF533 family)